MLSLRPLVFIGLISYSLYLWHWPIVAFAKYMMFRPLVAHESMSIIVLSIVLASFSWKYIEQPFRGRQPLFRERRRLFAAASVVMIVASGIGGFIFLKKGMGWRIERLSPGLTKTIDQAKNNPVWERQAQWDVIVKKIDNGQEPPQMGAENVEPSFALVGDSHARAIIPAFEYQANRARMSGYILTKASTPFLLGVSQVSSKADDGFDEVAYNDSVMEFIRSHPAIRTVFVVARWGGYINGHWVAKNEDDLHITMQDSMGQYGSDYPNSVILGVGLSRTVNTLRGMGRKVILVSDVPEIGYDVPRLFNLKTRFPLFVNGFDIQPTLAEYNMRQRVARGIFAELAKLPCVSLIHPERRMFDDKGRGRVMSEGKLLYMDDDHLSIAGALFVAPVFDEVFGEMAGHNNTIGMDGWPSSCR